MTPEPHQNLLTGGAETRLSDDPAAAELAGADAATAVRVVREHPASSLAWAVLAEEALHEQTSTADVAGYAYARVGYHRGLDALRRSGWRGSGPVPWEHEPNRGFLRCLWALAVAARRIGESDEYERCAQFLRDCSELGYVELTAGGALPLE